MQKGVTLACYITELKLSRAFQKGPVDRIIDKCTYCCYSPRLDILLKMCLRVESTSQWASRHEIRLCGTIFGLEKWALSLHSTNIDNGALEIQMIDTTFFIASTDFYSKFYDIHRRIWDGHELFLWWFLRWRDTALPSAFKDPSHVVVASSTTQYIVHDLLTIIELFSS